MSEKKIRVRKAEPKDIVNICNLLKKGWNLQTTEYAPIDEMRGYAWILGILREGFIAVADLNGRIVGAACGNPYRPQWSLQWMVDMSFLFILPSFREAGVAQELIKAVELFADEHEASMTFEIQTGDRPEVKDRMMKIAGWTYSGGHFLRPANVKGQRNNNRHK